VVAVVVVVVVAVVVVVVVVVAVVVVVVVAVVVVVVVAVVVVVVVAVVDRGRGVRGWRPRCAAWRATAGNLMPSLRVSR
jgi:hypothetical protein